MGLISKTEQLLFVKRGKEKEIEFAKLFSEAVAASDSEDINSHIDIKIITGVDVKGLKKINRKDNDTNEHYHWIEIRGVKDAGWLYSGMSLFFSFETIDYWIIVSKEDLKELVVQKIKKEYVLTPEEALYKLYRREGRKDILTRVKSLDLMHIATAIYDKV